MPDIRCTLCKRVIRAVTPLGLRRFFCWLLGHRISFAEINQEGVQHPNGKEYCHEEPTCKYCRKEVSIAKFAP